MNLLDLPPEVFEGIIAAYVIRAGIANAWRSREVCSKSLSHSLCDKHVLTSRETFASYITDDIFGRRSVKAFKDTRQGKILLKHGTALYLEYRSTALFGAQEILPSLVRGIVDTFMNITGTSSKERRGEYLKSTCAVVATRARAVGNFIFNPRKDIANCYLTDKIENDALAVAVAMQDMDLVRHLVTNCASTWTATYAFGLPLEIAVTIGDIGMVDLILEYSESKHTDVSVRKRVSLLSDSIRNSSSVRSSNCKIYDRITTTLIHWHCQHLGRPNVPACEYSFRFALRKKDQQLLDALLGLKLTHASKRAYAQALFDRPREMYHSLTEVFRTLLDMGIVNVNTAYRISAKYWSSSKPRHISALDFAVHTQDPHLVGSVLDASAHPDGVLLSDTPDSRTWPLREAIKVNNKDIVKLLLERGADPEAWDNRDSQCTLSLAREGSAVWNLLLEGIRKKIDLLGQEYRYPACPCMPIHAALLSRYYHPST